MGQCLNTDSFPPAVPDTASPSTTLTSGHYIPPTRSVSVGFHLIPPRSKNNDDTRKFTRHANKITNGFNWDNLLKDLRQKRKNDPFHKIPRPTLMAKEVATVLWRNY